MEKASSINKEYVLEWVDDSKTIKPTSIVLHWWNVPNWFGGLNWFLRRLRRKQLSAQFVILKDGSIYQLVKEPNVHCYHARCANESSIGVELQGFGQRDLDKQTKQFESLIELTCWLRNEYDIPIDFAVTQDNGLRFYGVTSHKEVDTYCDTRRLLAKRDVHQDYVEKLKSELKRH